MLGASALTVYALLRRFRPPRESIEQPQQQRALPPDVVDRPRRSRARPSDAARGYLLVPAVLVRLLLPVAVVVAAHLFLRGHNEPGGGFVAGLVVAIAFIAQYIVARHALGRGAHAACIRRAGSRSACCSRWPPGSARSRSAIRSSPRTPRTSTLPLLGDVHLPSATFFDLGVFAVGRRRDAADPDGARAPVAARARASRAAAGAAAAEAALMEVVLSLAIGVLGGAGVWLRAAAAHLPGAASGLSLLSYAVNLFIFSMGSLSIDKPSRSCAPGVPADLCTTPTRCRRRWC